MRSFFNEVVLTLLVALLIFFGLRATIQHSVVISSSMEPTLPVGQHLIINKIAYHFGQPQRGDIIVFQNVDGQQGELIKRVIGLPGESVSVEDDKVSIHKSDGTVLTLDEPYLVTPTNGYFKGGIIPENNYFVMGDNRNNSSDSRTGWTVPHANIVGKAWLSVWPPEDWGLAANYALPQ